MRLRELITDEEYIEQKNKLLKERCNIEEKLRDAENRSDRWLELTEKTFVFACYAKVWFEKGSLQDKKEILQTIGSNLILKDKKLRIELKKPFLIIEEGLKVLKGVPQEKGRFEPAKFGSNERKSPAFTGPSLHWRRIVDDVRTYFIINRYMKEKHPDSCVGYLKITFITFIRSWIIGKWPFNVHPKFIQCSC